VVKQAAIPQLLALLPHPCSALNDEQARAELSYVQHLLFEPETAWQVMLCAYCNKIAINAL